MVLYYLQHVFFETPAAILEWAKDRNYTIKKTYLYQESKFFDPDSFDILVIMGGPMGVYDEKKFPWLTEEKKFIESAIRKQKKIIGICLGAQLIANVLGANVYKNSYKEIGFFPVKLTNEAKTHNLFNHFPEEFITFHWHGDTFDLPADSIRTFRNNATTNQGFIYNENVVAFQFHLESTNESIMDLYKYSISDLNTNDKLYIQNYDKASNYFTIIKNLNQLLFNFLDKLVLI